jgi:hypothetical protein
MKISNGNQNLQTYLKILLGVIFFQFQKEKEHTGILSIMFNFSCKLL